MLEGIYAEAVFVAAIIIGATVAYWDLKTMTIPNWISISAAVIFLVIVFLGLGVEVALWRLAAAFGVLIVTFVLFVAGAMGGGDAKIAAAFAIPVAPIDLSMVLIILALSGLAALLVVSVLRRTLFSDGTWEVWSAGKSFPYGLPLAMTLIMYTGLVATIVS